MDQVYKRGDFRDFYLSNPYVYHINDHKKEFMSFRNNPSGNDEITLELFCYVILTLSVNECK